MRPRLTEVFSAAELQTAQVAIAKASGGCAVFFDTGGTDTLASVTTAIGRRVSLCCFNRELSLLCGRVAFEQGKVGGAVLSDTHKCRCGAYYYWAGVRLGREIGGYLQVRCTDELSRSVTHLVASHLRTLATVGTLRVARAQAETAQNESFVSLDHLQLYGHPAFPALARMISEAGRSLLHAGRCLFFSYDSARQLLSGEFASDLTEEQTYSLQIAIGEFPLARQALESMSFVVAEKNDVGSRLSPRHQALLGDGRLVVLPVWVVGHVLGFLVFTSVKTHPERRTGPLTLAEFGQAAAALTATLGLWQETATVEEDTAAPVGAIQRYAAMGQIAAEIGHDIQASLYGIKNYAYLLAKATRDDPRRATYSRAINEGIAYLERLSAEMRNLTGQPREVTYTQTDLARVIDSACLLLSPLATERGIAIEQDVPSDLPALVADPVALTEVFLNLGLNAIHSMSKGGTLRIRVRHEKQKVFITVQDNGTGISPEVLERFWNNSSFAARSFTNKGLYIVRRIIRQHYGTIELESQPGAGTTFFIELWVNPTRSVASMREREELPISFHPPEAELPETPPVSAANR